MKIFRLPDLGEGLPDAQIREWYVKVGDEVTVDQPLVSMETAKALVDVPAPFSGKIEKLFGGPDDTIETGQPLIGFEGEGEEVGIRKDTGTVVGNIESTEAVVADTATGIAMKKSTDEKIKATPAIRALAKKLGVDLNTITPSGPRITQADIEQAARKTPSAPQAPGWQKQSSARRAMVLSMTQSHQEVVPVTLSDDADIHAWPEGTDITLRLLRALAFACKKVPILNAHYNGKEQSFYLNEKINIGIAVDTEHGLYVPVLKDVDSRDDASLREQINQFKTQAQTKSIASEDLRGATIMLSNFGTFAGRYGSPIVVPPCVAIVAVGKTRDSVVAFKGQPCVHRIMPLSLTFDHRPITGGEAARFLAALIEKLESLD